MPVVNFHLVDGLYTDEQADRLLVGAVELYAKVLEAPMERIRAFITSHAAAHMLVAGKTARDSGVHAPLFEFIILEGRSLEQRHTLMAGFTELLANTLDVDTAVVRGFCRQVAPEEWAIGGVPASVMRKQEIDARKAAADAGAGKA